LSKAGAILVAGRAVGVEWPAGGILRMMSLGNPVSIYHRQVVNSRDLTAHELGEMVCAKTVRQECVPRLCATPRLVCRHDAKRRNGSGNRRVDNTTSLLSLPTLQSPHTRLGKTSKLKASNPYESLNVVDKVVTMSLARISLDLLLVTPMGLPLPTMQRLGTARHNCFPMTTVLFFASAGQRNISLKYQPPF
jgi:hypothetical protein